MTCIAQQLSRPILYGLSLLMGSVFLVMYAFPTTKRLKPAAHFAHAHCSNGFPEIYRTQSNTYSGTVQDFLIKLDIKPLMHLLEIIISSLNNDLVRLTKIMNNLVKDLKILSFKVIFQCQKLVESFPKKNPVKNI